MPITYLVMILTFVLSLITGNSPGLFIKLMLHPATVVRERELYRLVTSDFVHNNFIHLGLNEFLLFFVCGRLESFLRLHFKNGELDYFIIYLSSMLVASACVTLLRYKKFDYSSVGSSGTILGCMLSYMVLQPYLIGFYLPVIGGVNNIFTALILIMGLIVYQVRSQNPYVSHEVHFFGAVGGLVSTILLFQLI